MTFTINVTMLEEGQYQVILDDGTNASFVSYVHTHSHEQAARVALLNYEIKHAPRSVPPAPEG